MNIEAYLDGPRAVRILSEGGAEVLVTTDSQDDARELLELLDRASRVGVEKIEILNVR